VLAVPWPALYPAVRTWLGGAPKLQLGSKTGHAAKQATRSRPLRAHRNELAKHQTARGQGGCVEDWLTEGLVGGHGGVGRCRGCDGLVLWDSVGVAYVVKTWLARRRGVVRLGVPRRAAPVGGDGGRGTGRRGGAATVRARYPRGEQPHPWVGTPVVFRPATPLSLARHRTKQKAAHAASAPPCRNRDGGTPPRRTGRRPSLAPHCPASSLERWRRIGVFPWAAAVTG
jgi:hypothetical protein